MYLYIYLKKKSVFNFQPWLVEIISEITLEMLSKSQIWQKLRWASPLSITTLDLHSGQVFVFYMHICYLCGRWCNIYFDVLFTQYLYDDSY